MKITYILIFLLLLFIIVPVKVYCQDSTAATVSNTVQLLDNIRSDIKSGVVSIAEYLKEVSPMVYQATKQKIIAQGWIAIFSCVHLPILLTVTLIGNSRKWNGEGMIFLWGFTVISSIICVIALVIFLPQIFAPDYYTIQEIIRMIR